MDAVRIINWIISIIFFVCYTYQFFYIPVIWFFKDRKHKEATPHSYAVLICARNEKNVIGDLLTSIREQTYDASLIHIFVLADNCTDDTAAIARSYGATVYERFNKVKVGKGYALEALMGHIRQDFPEGFDGYMVFDADNILSPDYIEQMNRTFSDGHDIVTSYRNSKNFGDNWISSGYALWYLRESRYLNHARYRLGSSCAVGGTGFLFSRAVADELGGWPFHMLVEDIEFSIHEITRGRKIAMCPDAVLYDEQPTGFVQSWRQRERWCKGGLQVFAHYGLTLVKGIFKGSWSCFDMTMNFMPAFFLSVVGLIANIVLAVHGAIVGENLMIAVQSLAEMLFHIYLTMFAIGAITVATEWKRIRAAGWKKVLFSFTFPLFMFTYMPIAVSVLFKKVEWKPIEHTVSAEKLKKRSDEEALPF
jgi:cellulose synthase/poly-beta-1,6-N-acetylglucosamine synthase-like glycosyltransferase